MVAVTVRHQADMGRFWIVLEHPGYPRTDYGHEAPVVTHRGDRALIPENVLVSLSCVCGWSYTGDSAEAALEAALHGRSAHRDQS